MFLVLPLFYLLFICLPITGMILSPVLDRADFSEDRIRFRPTEIAGLILYLSVPLALGSRPYRTGRLSYPGDELYVIVMTVIMVLFALVMWLVVVLALTQARIQDARKRAAFLVVVPLAALVPLLAVVGLMAVVTLFFSDQPEPLKGLLLLVVIAAGTPLLLLATSRISRWVATGCEPYSGPMDKYPHLQTR